MGLTASFFVAPMASGRACSLWLALAVAFAGQLHAAEASNRQTTTADNAKLLVEPPVIRLWAANRRQQLLVTAQGVQGPVDVTHQAVVTANKSEIIRMEGSTVLGAGDGSTELTVTWNGHAVTVPVTVAGFGQSPPIHFVNDVIPVFSKLGCNSGGCHGRAAGQNGFKLSVFGFDPISDYEALVSEARGRRLFLANPVNSLLLTKPTGGVPHGGGQRLKVGSDDYQVLRHWIEQGMPHGDPQAPTVTGLRVSPIERVLGTRQTQQILATAIYSDGSERDVTAAAAYASNATTIVEVDARGLVRTGTTPGEGAITVNYMGQVGAVLIQVPRVGSATDHVFPPANNRVDEFVWAKLQKLGIPPSEGCDDATFFRRVHLDTIGCLPRPAAVRGFLADPRPEKRRVIIDELLERPEYADLWALKWADILLVDRDKLGDRGAFELHRWLHEQFTRNRPYDEWTRELITATGSTALNGPANLFRAVDTPDALARVISQAFLGVRLECAQCHHHPFERWSQEDFYGFAGFFNGLERKPFGTNRVLVYHTGLRETRIPRTEQLVATRPLGEALPTTPWVGDPRVPLAQWMTARENPWFARLAVNRLWKHYLGRGLVESEDDLRSTNPSTNEPLLAYLAAELVENKFDLKHVMRLILNSRVYQLSSMPNAENFDDEQNFSHYQIKRLPAEVLMDAMSAVTEVPEAFPGRVPGTRAVQLWDNRLPSYFLEIFGRPERNSPCECGRSSEPTMAQALHLMNAPEVEAKLTHPNGRIARLVAADITDDELVAELALAALGRLPKDAERQVARDLFASSPRRKAAEDTLWTLLNSYDFLFNR